MAWTVDVDGNDITSICQTIRWRPKLNRPASCIVRFPAGLFSAPVGTSELHLSNGGLLFSGPVWFQQSDGTEDAAYTELTAYDHTIYLQKRMCKTGTDYPAPPSPNYTHEPGPCNLADPRAVITDNVTCTEILRAFINATNDCDPAGLPITVGSCATGGDNVVGEFTDWPMDIQTFANILLQTGQLDIMVNPGYGSSSVDLYNGDAGTDRSGSVSLQYATGSFNSRRGNRTSDMEQVINALWYLLGPKQAHYTGDITHWGGSITPTARDGGPDGDGPLPGTPWPPALVSRWSSSRSTYGYFQEIRVLDAKEDEQKIRDMFETLFAQEAYLRAVPRTFAYLSPDRTTAGPSFYVGDKISVSAGGILGGGFSGTVRVYEYEITVDTDGIGEFTDLTTSDNQD